MQPPAVGLVVGQHQRVRHLERRPGARPVRLGGVERQARPAGRRSPAGCTSRRRQRWISEPRGPGESGRHGRSASSNAWARLTKQLAVAHVEQVRPQRAPRVGDRARRVRVARSRPTSAPSRPVVGLARDVAHDRLAIILARAPSSSGRSSGTARSATRPRPPESRTPRPARRRARARSSASSRESAVRMTQLGRRQVRQACWWPRRPRCALAVAAAPFVPDGLERPAVRVEGAVGHAAGSSETIVTSSSKSRADPVDRAADVGVAPAALISPPRRRPRPSGLSAHDVRRQRLQAHRLAGGSRTGRADSRHPG